MLALGPGKEQPAKLLHAAEHAARRLQQIFPERTVSVNPIGSAATGMARSTSDLDLAVDIDGVSPDEAVKVVEAELRRDSALKR